MKCNYIICVLVFLAACSEKQDDQIRPNSKPRNVTIVSQYKINGEWVDQVRAQHLYNDTGKTVLVQVWNNNDNIWGDLYKEIYGKHGMAKQNWTNGAWVEAYREEYLLDARDSVIEKIQYNNSGDPNFKTVLTYGNNDKVTREMSYAWNNNQWYFSRLAKHIYTEQGEPIEDGYYSNPDTTQFFLRYTYTLDEKGHRISAKAQGKNNYLETSEYTTLPDGRFSSFISTNVNGGGNQVKVNYTWEN